MIITKTGISEGNGELGTKEYTFSEIDKAVFSLLGKTGSPSYSVKLGYLRVIGYLPFIEVREGREKITYLSEIEYPEEVLSPEELAIREKLIIEPGEKKGSYRVIFDSGEIRDFRSSEEVRKYITSLV